MEEWTIDTLNNMDRSQGYYAMWKEPISEGHMLYDPTYMTFSKWYSCWDGEQITGCQGLVEEQGWESDQKEYHKGDIYGGASVLYFDCGGDHTNLHIW